MFDAYKRFFHFAGAQKSTWYKGMAFEFVRSIFEAFQFFALLVVFRALVENKMSGATAALAFGIMAVSVAGAALFWYLAHNSEGHANYQMCAEKRIHIGERMKYMPMGYFNAQSLGSLTAAATSTMDDLESMSFAVIARTMVGMIRTAIFSLAIFFFDWRIGAVFLLGMLLFLLVNARLLKKSRQLSPGRLAAQTKLVDAVLEYIQGMSVVRAFHGERAAKQTLNDTIIETERQNFKLERKRIPYNVLEQIVLRATSMVAILLSVWLFLMGSMSLFTCLMMVISAFLVYSELESAGEMFFMLPMIDASIDRVEAIDRAPKMDAGGSVQTPKTFDIKFDHVSFSYGARRIIDDVSFTIPERTTTAIVGPSGSGKTTLTSLMARFWDVDQGAVRIGGIDVRDYALDSLMENISMVFQNVYLFNDTIENNIKFGKPQATHEEVVAAAKAACCNDFISELPDGYQTVIGEGGATLINDKALIERAEIIREKGTNRSQFFRGQVDKYTWRDIGSSYLMSDLQAAYLWAQLEAAERINQQRLALWQNYYDALAPLAKNGRIELPSIPDGCVQNAHMFYIKLRDIDDRSALINFLKEAEIMAVFHYIPLHGCPAGERFGEFHGEDRYTTKESERLLRLPLFYNLSPVNQRTVIATLLNYFS